MHLLRISTNITNGTNQIKPIKLMTNNVAIKVENLSKRYRIGQYGVLGLGGWVLGVRDEGNDER